MAEEKFRDRPILMSALGREPTSASGQSETFSMFDLPTIPASRSAVPGPALQPIRAPARRVRSSAAPESVQQVRLSLIEVEPLAPACGVGDRIERMAVPAGRVA
jgi:hypothetical protein